MIIAHRPATRCRRSPGPRRNPAALRLTLRLTLHLIPAIALVSGMAACSSSDAGTLVDPSTPTISQQAPSVWAPATTTSSNSSAGGESADRSTTTAPSNLPGLSSSCTGALRAQQTTLDLFASAMKTAQRGSDTTAATTTTSPTSGRSSSTPSTPASGAPPSAEVDATTALTAHRVEAAFTEITDDAPAGLDSQFAVLHKAATSMVGSAIGDIPTIVNSDPVSQALAGINEYLASCAPRGSQASS